jgi:predicted transcriptional regulator
MTPIVTETLLSKAQILDSLKELPDQISADALIEHILFIQSIATGIEQAEAGHVTPHKDAMLDIRSWKK